MGWPRFGHVLDMFARSFRVNNNNTYTNESGDDVFSVSGGIVRTNALLFSEKSTEFKSTLDVTGATTLKSTLNVTGETTLKSTLDVTGATILQSTLNVTGATTLSDTLNVTKATTLSDTLNVTGATQLQSTLDVTGMVTLYDVLQLHTESQTPVSLAEGQIVYVNDNGDKKLCVGVGGFSVGTIAIDIPLE